MSESYVNSSLEREWLVGEWQKLDYYYIMNRGLVNDTEMKYMLSATSRQRINLSLATVEVYWDTMKPWRID